MDRRLVWVFIVLLVMALARYVAVAFFVHPFADDFSYAVAGMHHDLLPRLLDEYRYWNGRWFSNILVLRGPLVLGMEQGLWLYRVVPVVLMGLTWCGALSLIRAIAPAVERARALIGASLFLLLYLQIMPDLGEGIYWYTGAVSYQLPGALMLFLCAGWIRMLCADEQVPLRAIVLNALLAAIIAGCNELHMVFMVLLHVAVLVLRWRSNGRTDGSVAIVLVVVVIAAAVMVLAPGNAGRGGQFPHKHEVLRTMGWGAVQTARFLATWILSPALLIVSVLFLSISGWLHERSPLLARAFGLRPWTVIGLLVVPVFLAMALPYWSTGLLGQHRTVNATLLFFLPLWFVLLSAVDLHWLRPSGRPRVPMNARFRAIAYVLLAVVVFATGNGGMVSSDLVSGRLNDFDGTLSQRYELIEEARMHAKNEVHLPKLVTLPISLRYHDGAADPGQWINRSLANYFQADTLDVWIGEVAKDLTSPLPPR